MDQNRVYFFDTTLRDGEQTPGVSLQTPEKIEIAKGLVRLGIDVIEAGFPAASPGDLKQYKRLHAKSKVQQFVRWHVLMKRTYKKRLMH